jgi:hypothetical protein
MLNQRFIISQLEKEKPHDQWNCDFSNQQIQSLVALLSAANIMVTIFHTFCFSEIQFILLDGMDLPNAYQKYLTIVFDITHQFSHIVHSVQS